MGQRPDKHLPYLTGFLKYAQQDPMQARADTTIGAGVAMTIFGSPMVAITMGVAFQNFAAGIAAGVAAVVAGGFLTYVIQKRRAQPRTEQEKALRNAVFAAKPFQALRGRSRLHKEADPRVLQLLEAASYHWSRIHAACHGAQWGHPDLPPHWSGVRGQAMLAADQAMADLFMHAQRVIGEPQRSKEQELGHVVEDFVSLDIADALNGLKKVAGSDWTQYAHKSPHAEVVMQTGLPVAERLQQLADEMEETAGRLTTMELGGVSESPMNTQTLDSVLGEIRAVRQADDELRVQQRIGE